MPKLGVIGTVGVSGVAQVVSLITGAAASGTTIIPLDDTIPQITEGKEFMSLSITPKNVNNKLKIQVVVVLNSSAPVNAIVALFKDSTSNALAVAATLLTSSTRLATISFNYILTAATISATTFTVRCGLQSAGTFYFNSISSGRLFGGAAASSIIIQEIIVA